MASKKTKSEAKTLTREAFSPLHIAYSGKDAAQFAADFATLFKDSLRPESSLLDEALLDYLANFAYECKRNSIPYYKFYFAHRLSLLFLHIISTGRYSIDDLKVALLSKLSSLLSPAVGLTYDLSGITSTEYENASEPTVIDDKHESITYRDHIVAIECYNTLTDLNKQPSEPASQAKPGAKPKQPSAEVKRYSFVLSLREASLLSKLYSPLMQCHTLWKQCFLHQKSFIEGIEYVPIPSNPHILSLPPLAVAYPYKKLPALETKIIEVARPKAAELYTELKSLISSKASKAQ